VRSPCENAEAPLHRFHKPGRTDVEMTEIETAARAAFASTDAAGEGDTFEI
jgi:hypothetical protein